MWLGLCNQTVFYDIHYTSTRLFFQEGDACCKCILTYPQVEDGPCYFRRIGQLPNHLKTDLIKSFFSQFTTYIKQNSLNFYWGLLELSTETVWATFFCFFFLFRLLSRSTSSGGEWVWLFVNLVMENPSVVARALQVAGLCL